MELREVGPISMTGKSQPSIGPCPLPRWGWAKSSGAMAAALWRLRLPRGAYMYSPDYTRNVQGFLGRIHCGVFLWIWMLEFAQSIRQIVKTHISFSKKEWPLESIVHGVGSYIVLLDSKHLKVGILVGDSRHRSITAILSQGGKSSPRLLLYRPHPDRNQPDEALPLMTLMDHYRLQAQLGTASSSRRLTSDVWNTLKGGTWKSLQTMARVKWR